MPTKIVMPKPLVETCDQAACADPCEGLFDPDVRIVRPQRVERMVTMRFVQAGRRQPKIRDNPNACKHNLQAM